MNNKTLQSAARGILKNLLAQCTEAQQMVFKRMYSHENLNLAINEVVDKMEVSKMDHAISQCELTIKNNLTK